MALDRHSDLCTLLTLADFSFPEKRMYAPKEIAKHLGVSIRTIYREIESGDLRALRVRGSWRVCRSELEAYLMRSQSA